METWNTDYSYSWAQEIFKETGKIIKTSWKKTIFEKIKIIFSNWKEFLTFQTDAHK